jgi:hypothetical protein
MAVDAPTCLDNDRSPMEVNNDQVLNWKTSTDNEYHDRGNVTGTITQLYANATGHQHFQLQIGPNDSDTVEIVYDMEFGGLPKLTPGMQVQACGDYITSNAPYQSYKPSPDGALIHWVHWSDKPQKHVAGFLMVQGSLYGQRHAQMGFFKDALNVDIAR